MTQIVLFACAIISIGVISAHARTWTLAELDTLSDREWIWVDSKYKERISDSADTIGRLEQLPKRRKNSNPKYPEIASRDGIEGSVWVKALIDKNGLVRVAHILEDSEKRVGFEESALEAARKCYWKPAYRGEDRVAVWVKYEVAFYLNTTKWNEPIHAVEPWFWRVKFPTVYTNDVDTAISEMGSELPDMSEFIGIEEAPKQLKSHQPIYPKVAVKSGLEGSVWVKILVNTEGRVEAATVAKESGSNCGFEEAALWSAINGEWVPAKQDHKPIALWITYEIQFRFKK